MLKHLTLENFKSWKKAEIDFGRLTGFFGTNSSGKSSLLQFLLALKQTNENLNSKEDNFDFEGSYTKLGIYKDAVRDHDEKLSINYNIIFKGGSYLQGGINKNIIVVEKKSITLVNDSTFSIYQKKELDKKDIILIEKSLNNFEISRDSNSNEGVNDTNFRHYIQNMGDIAGYAKINKSFYSNIYYLGPLRHPPQRDYYWANTRQGLIGNAGEKTIDVILAKSIEDQMLEQKIAENLKKLGIINSFKLVEIAKNSNRWTTKLTISQGDTEVAITDVGFGISQILPVITLINIVPKGSTLIFEQPELHLHPLAQANLADVLVDVAKERDLQIIFESHSEQLLLRLQRRIAEEKTTNEEVKLYFCDKSNEGSKLVPLDIDEFGMIKNYPKNFMGDALGEVVAAEKSRLARIRKNA